MLVSETERILQALITWFTQGCQYSRGGGGVGAVGERLPPVHLKHLARRNSLERVEIVPPSHSGLVADNYKLHL